MLEPKIVLLLVALSMHPIGKQVPAEYVSNYDGDTISINTELVPGVVFKDVSVRIEGIDTAEMNDPCKAAKDKARAAKQETAGFLKQPDGHIVLSTVGEVDKYLRPLVHMSVNGVDLGQFLAEKGLAMTWQGSRKPWC